MKKYFLLIALSLMTALLVAQESNHYFGISYGKSFPLGDFATDDLNNPNAGFAESGNKLDLYAGRVLGERTILTLTFRYQSFDTDIDALVEGLQANNESTAVTGSSGSWKTYSLLLGLEYRVKISGKFHFFPRIGLGPMLVSNPQYTITATDGNDHTTMDRSSGTGLGLGYEFGIGLKRDFGRHFSLMPTFMFSGGFVTLSDIDTTIDNTVTSSTQKPKILTFNLGLSLAYRF